MPYIIFLGFIVVGITFFLAFNSGQNVKAQANPLDSVIAESTQSAEPDNTMSKEAIINRLKKLAESPAPTNLNMGAMCYKMAGPPDRIEYVCPVCGEKTLYASDKNNVVNYSVIQFIDRDLGPCRIIAKSITKVKITLDETQFCRKCDPKAKNPALCLTIYYPQDKTSHSICNVEEEDLVLLSEFFADKDKHEYSNDQEVPLKNSIKRLEKLLGVTIK